jgi:hypothetical protein
VEREWPHIQRLARQLIRRRQLSYDEVVELLLR